MIHILPYNLTELCNLSFDGSIALLNVSDTRLGRYGKRKLLKCGIVTYQLRFDEHDNEASKHIRDGVRLLRYLIKTYHHVVVTCSYAINRSPAIVISYYIKYSKMDVNEAIMMVKSQVGHEILINPEIYAAIIV